MSLALAVLTVSVAVGVHVSLTSPTPTAPKNRRVMGDYPGIVFVAVVILKYACYFHAAVELSIIVASAISQQLPQSSVAQWTLKNLLAASFPLNDSRAVPRIGLSPARVMGGLSVVLGSVIRYLCYRELGRHFTYHVALLQNHSLVTTGPYSLVRHPAYIGGNFVQVGLVVWHAASGSWLRESGLHNTVLAWSILFPALGAVGSILVMYVRRPIVEDKLLRKEFGKKWEDWARAVPYRLIPSVY